MKILATLLLVITTKSFSNPFSACSFIQTFQMDWLSSSLFSWSPIGSLVQATLTVPFPKTFKNANVYLSWRQGQVYFQNYGGFTYNWIFFVIDLPANITNSQFIFNLVTITPIDTRISMMGISVLLISSYVLLTNNIYIQHYSQLNQQFTLESSNRQYSILTQCTYDLTGFVGIAMLRGLNYYSNLSFFSNYQIELSNITNRTVIVTIKNAYSYRMYLKGHHYTIVLYNNFPINFCNMKYEITFFNQQQSFTNNYIFTLLIFQNQIFYGVSAVDKYNHNYFQFNISINITSNMLTFSTWACCQSIKFQLLVINITNTSVCTNQFYNANTNICSQCINYINLIGNSVCGINCNECCLDTNQCYSCQSPFNLVIGGCTNQLGCNNVIANQTMSVCQSCESPLVLGSTVNANDTCSCLSGFYANNSASPFVCLACFNYCSICNKISEVVICNKCKESFVLINNSCLCQSTQYLVTDLCTNIIGCNLVQLISPNSPQTICKSCSIPLNFIQYNSINICQCPSGFVITLDQLPFYCKSCPINCKTCIVNTSNSLTCIKCEDQHNLNSTNNRCECSKGMWMVTNICTDMFGCKSIINVNDTKNVFFVINQKALSQQMMENAFAKMDFTQIKLIKNVYKSVEMVKHLY